MIKNHGPWTITETILKYKNKWIQVTEDRVIRPDGQPGIFGIVTMNPGVSVLPVDEQGYVYIISNKEGFKKEYEKHQKGGL